jgi:hypothetical protein
VAPGDIRRLPEEKSVELTRPLGLGLVAAHERSVMQRDPKPSKVMIVGRGPVRLNAHGRTGRPGRRDRA